MKRLTLFFFETGYPWFFQGNRSKKRGLEYVMSVIDGYMNDLPVERQESFGLLRRTIVENLPQGFEEGMLYGMIGGVCGLKTLKQCLLISLAN